MAWEPQAYSYAYIQTPKKGQKVEDTRFSNCTRANKSKGEGSSI